MAEREPKKPWDQTWAERNNGWEHRDSLGRWVGLRYSRFHGLMISTGSSTVYIDDAEPAMREWLANAPAVVAATADDQHE